MKKSEQPEQDVDSDSCTHEEIGESGGKQFQTLEEVQKAYGEIRAAFTRKTQELARVKKMQEALIGEPAQKKEDKAEGGVSVTVYKNAEETARIFETQQAEKTEEEAPSEDANNHLAQTERADAEGEKTTAAVQSDGEKNPLFKHPDKPDSETARREIIKEYLQSVALGMPPPVIANSPKDFAFTNLSEAKSICQVEKVVTDFFKTKGTQSI